MVEVADVANALVSPSRPPRRYRFGAPKPSPEVEKLFTRCLELGAGSDSIRKALMETPDGERALANAEARD